MERSFDARIRRGAKRAATQLALVIEAAPEDGVPAQDYSRAGVQALGEVIELPIVAKHLGPLLERHKRSIENLARTVRSKMA